MRGKTDGVQKKKVITSLCVMVILLGFLFVYYGSIFGSRVHPSEYGRSIRKLGSSYWGSDDDEISGKQDGSSRMSQEDGEVEFIPKSFPVCDDRHSELIPCLDRNLIYQMRLKLELTLMEHYERHCPLPERRFNCLIPPPSGYKIPIKWPKSRDEVWKANIPHTHLAHEKSDQNWMVVKGEKIEFPGGGTHFHYGADKYIASLANMLNFTGNNLNNEGRVRTVLDVGCGVASFGAYLLSSDIIAMSLAPNDVHQNQIQFALERGIPAYLGVLGTKRLPYPSRSFELAHCSRCRIDWLQRDGILLLELDRLLRPGGYFAYSSPEAYADDPVDRRIWKEMSALVERMCWKIAAKRNQTVIWVKPLTNDCYYERETGTLPPLCRPDDDPDAVWDVPMEACITPYSDQNHEAKGSGLVPWPARLAAPPPRLADFGYTKERFEKDTELWQRRVENYWNLLKPKIRPNTVRNLMDMKANLGSFAAALKDKDVWVMNVVPEDGPNTLKIIYDRGLIGTTHDCDEALVCLLLLFGGFCCQGSVLCEFYRLLLEVCAFLVGGPSLSCCWKVSMFAAGGLFFARWCWVGVCGCCWVGWLWSGYPIFIMLLFHGAMYVYMLPRGFYILYRCEAFSTYPRTYDLLHAWMIISDIEKKHCSVEDLLIEMDRIVRPSGFIIVRDKRASVAIIKKYLSALHWESVGESDQDSEVGDEVVFVIQKMWPAMENIKDSE